MEGLALIFTLGIIIVGGFLAWTYTKKGTSNIQKIQIINSKYTTK